MLKVLLQFCLILLSGVSLAQQEKSAPKGGEPGWEPPKQVKYSKKETVTECRKYRNQYIGYYGKVYKVEGCKRRELDSNAVKKLMKRRGKVKEVDPSTIAKIPPGDPLNEVGRQRSCKELDGRYILSVGGDMYFVKNCQKLLLPDWETYVDHSKKRGQKKVYDLSDREFASLKKGRPIPSVLDKEFRNQGVTEFEVDVIPLSEACSGVNGRIVSYYSKVYKIENCRKREVLDPSAYLKKRKSSKILEISSEQWISLPNGKQI